MARKKADVGGKKTAVGASGAGAQSAAPGPSRKCRPLVRAVVLYLWRHRAHSTMVALFHISVVTVGDWASQDD